MNKMRKKGAMRLPKSTTKLKQYFPMIREREDIKREIRENPKLLEKYREWDEEQQEEFLDYCTGVKGEKKKAFSYKDIKSVYTIVFFETSIKEFHEYPQNYIYKFKQQSDTGLELELLQKYVFIPLDIFRGIYHNDGKSNGRNSGSQQCKVVKRRWNKTEAWLTFLSTDEPEIIIELIRQYPEFKEMYEEIYVMCQNVEKVMEMFSKELIQLDRNTVQYMIDEMQDTIDVQKEELEAKQNQLNQKEEELETMKHQLQLAMEQIEQLKKQ